MAEGEFALGKQHLEKALQTPGEWIGDHDLYALLADGAVEQGDEATLRQYAHLAEETAMRYEHKLDQAIAQRALGVLQRLTGNYGEAETRLQRALALFSELDTRWQLGRTYFELGELAGAQSNNHKAREHYTQALHLFEVMQARPYVERTRAAITRVVI